MSNVHDITIIAGLSGVGKSYVISTLMGQQKGFSHFSAGSLIKKRLSHPNRDKLRELHGDVILANQYLMVEQFKEDLAASENPMKVLFDAHMLIDGEHGTIDIPYEIFEQLSPARIIFLSDDVDTIIQRRESDVSRIRPKRTALELTQQQERAFALAMEYSARLSIPFFNAKSGDVLGLQNSI
jgi:adenylate kinase